jgi:transposase-like protein
MTVLTTISRPGTHAGVVTDHSSGEVPERARRRTFTAAYKLKIVEEYEGAEPGMRGEVLRREGLYSSHLTEWRKARDVGALAGLAATRGRPPADPVERDNARLRERNTRLEVELDTARRVIEVQGKVSALLEDLSRRAHDASEAVTPSPSGPSSPPRSSR